MEISKIRKLIVNNRMTEAFQMLENSVPLDWQDDVTLLNAQFNHWDKNNRLNLGTQIEEKNRIIYATLHIVSQVEKISSKGLQKRRLNALADIENDLAKGYQKLGDLRDNNVIDLFMMWIKTYYSDEYHKILAEESQNGRASNFTYILSTLDLKQFINQHNLKASPQQTRNYFIRKNSEKFMFFTEWVEYNNYRYRYATDLSKEIEKYKQKHNSLLKAGVIGGLVGAATVSFFEKTIDGIMDLYESDTEENDYSEIEDNNNDDDDDDD